MCVIYILQCTATHSDTRTILQHTATRCNTLQHTATHCNTTLTCDRFDRVKRLRTIQLRHILLDFKFSKHANIQVVLIRVTKARFWGARERYIFHNLLPRMSSVVRTTGASGVWSICVYVNICIYVYICIHICVYICTHIYVFIHIQACEDMRRHAKTPWELSSVYLRGVAVCCIGIQHTDLYNVSCKIRQRGGSFQPCNWRSGAEWKKMVLTCGSYVYMHVCMRVCACVCSIPVPVLVPVPVSMFMPVSVSVSVSVSVPVPVCVSMAVICLSLCLCLCLCLWCVPVFVSWCIHMHRCLCICLWYVPVLVCWCMHMHADAIGWSDAGNAELSSAPTSSCRVSTSCRCVRKICIICV